MKEDDLKRFGRVKAGYEPINRSTIKKPKSASLWFDDGAVKKKLENNVSFASKIIAETLDHGLIKPSDPENISKKFASYIPFWA